MASRGQGVTVTYVAWDVNANAPKDGDVFNHTLRWIKDGTSSAPTNSPSQVDATNAPGVYRLALTSTETTCDVGTLAGKSSTANVVIIPLTISFELLPTYAIGTNGSIATIDGTGRVASNVTAINGSSTSGNNATLKLKSLDIRSNDPLVTPVFIFGGDGAAGENGGSGVAIIGGNAGVGGLTGGFGMYIRGGTGATRVGLYLDGQVGGSGLKVTGNGTYAAIFDSDTGKDISANIEGNLTGSIGNITSIRPKKNASLDNFMFPMFDATTKNPKAGLTVTAERAIDGNPFSPCSNAAVELSNGVYRVSLSADDLNGNKIMLRFSATGADDQLIEIITQD